jgi:hypothetical protein
MAELASIGLSYRFEGTTDHHVIYICVYAKSGRGVATREYMGLHLHGSSRAIASDK